jgi:hypothetical protein
MTFAFGDQVQVASAERTSDYADKVGHIVGIGEDEGDGASYAVSFPDDIHTVTFWESELRLTSGD